MYASQGNRATAYAKVGMETGVMAADAHKLTLMLYEGALLAIARARLHLQDQRCLERKRLC